MSASDAKDCDGEVYCAACGSCGCGGCCPYYCERCKGAHDDLENAEEVAPWKERATLRAEIASLRARCEAAERERDAYRKAKGENDERFMRERDDAREEANAIRMDLRNVEAILADETRLRVAAERARDEARAEVDALIAALTLLVEWGARGHNPNDIAPWVRATQTLKDARARRVLSGEKEGV